MNRSAFLLAQLGSFSSERFAARVHEVGLTPAEAGILRQLGARPGISQRELASLVGVTPSRLVGLIDSLAARELVRRERSATDRRNHELTLSAQGRAVLAELRGVAEAHEDDVLAPLSTNERERLAALLGKLADGHALSAELHRDTA